MIDDEAPFPGVVHLYSRSLFKMQAPAPYLRCAESVIAGLGAYGSRVFKDVSGDSSGADLVPGPRWVWTSGSQLSVILPVLSRGHPAMSGNIFGCHNSGSATGQVGRDQSYC